MDGATERRSFLAAMVRIVAGATLGRIPDLAFGVRRGAADEDNLTPAMMDELERRLLLSRQMVESLSFFEFDADDMRARFLQAIHQAQCLLVEQAHGAKE